MLTKSTFLLGISCLIAVGSCKEPRKQTIINPCDWTKKHPILLSSKSRFEEIFQLEKIIQLSWGRDHLLGLDLELAIGKRDESFLILDRMVGRSVYLFDSTGKYVMTIGNKGRGPGEYERPMAIDFDTFGKIYVYDKALLRVNIFDADGAYLNSFKVDKYFNKLRINSNNELYFYTSTTYDSDGSSDAMIFEYDANGKFQRSFCPQSTNFVAAAASWGGGIAIDSNDFIYQISPYEYKLQVFAADGECLMSNEHVPDYYREPSKPNFNLQADIKALGKWHASWTHIFNIHLLENCLVLIFTQDRVLGKAEHHLDIFDTSGKGIKFKIESSMEAALSSCAKGPFLYFPQMSKDDGRDDFINPQIVKYRIR